MIYRFFWFFTHLIVSLQQNYCLSSIQHLFAMFGATILVLIYGKDKI